MFRRSDGSTLRLENGIGVPSEMADVFKPGLRGEFLTYAVPIGRRGVSAIHPKGGTARAVFKVPGEGMYGVMAIITLITIIFSPFAIWFYLQYADIKKTKLEGEALYRARV